MNKAASGVIAQSGVLAPESSGDQIGLCYLNTVFELYSGDHFGQVVEAAYPQFDIPPYLHVWLLVAHSGL